MYGILISVCNGYTAATWDVHFITLKQQSYQGNVLETILMYENGQIYY